MFDAFGVIRQLHELLWYLTDALAQWPARSLRDELVMARGEVERLTRGSPAELADLDVPALRNEVNELLEAEFPEGDFDTVGGLMLNLLGHVPQEGESVDVDGHRLFAEKVQGRRIGRVRIAKIEHPAASDMDEPDSE